MKIYLTVIFKLIITLLLFVSLTSAASEYFSYIKIACCILFSFFVFIEFKDEKLMLCALSAVCVILFNPFFEVELKQVVWNYIDLAIAIIVAIWLLIDLIVYIFGEEPKDVNEKPQEPRDLSNDI